MEKIALESLRLIAADYVSQQVIDELRSEGIYSIKNSPNVHVNVVLVSTDKGADNVHKMLDINAHAKRYVVISMSGYVEEFLLSHRRHGRPVCSSSTNLLHCVHYARRKCISTKTKTEKKGKTRDDEGLWDVL